MSEIRFGVTPSQRALLVDAILQHRKKIEAQRDNALDDGHLPEAQECHKALRDLDGVYLALNVEQSDV